MNFNLRLNRRSAGRESSGLDCSSALRTKPPNCKNGFLGGWKRKFRSPSGTNSLTFCETAHCQLTRNRVSLQKEGPSDFFCALPNYCQFCRNIDKGGLQAQIQTGGQAFCGAATVTTSRTRDLDSSWLPLSIGQTWN